MTNFNIIKDDSSTSNSSLLARVLGYTAVAFVFTAVGTYLAPNNLSGLGLIVAFVISLALIFAINFTKDNTALSLGLFYLFAFIMGIEISPVILHYLHHGHASVIYNAAITTAGGMAVIGCIAQLVSFDYNRVSNYASGALLLLIIAGIISMFTHFISPNVYSWITLAIFSVFTLVDFARIKDDKNGNTAVELALNIYLDAVNIFLALIQLFSNNDNSD